MTDNFFIPVTSRRNLCRNSSDLPGAPGTSNPPLSSITLSENMNTRLNARYVLAVTTALLLGTTSSLADTVGGSVTAILELVKNPVSNITIGSSTPGASNAQTDTTIVSGTIDTNYDRGWKLTVTSANGGKLFKGAGGAGRQITYTNVKFVSGSGTLGAGLTDPSTVAGGVLSVATVPAVFDTRTTGSGGALATATTATVAFAYSLKISWSSDLTLLAGTYTDTITLDLENDS